MAASIIIYLVPPSQADHQPPCNILETKQRFRISTHPQADSKPAVERHKTQRTHFDCPEVAGEQEDDRHHGGDETTAEELTKQIGEDGGHPEEEVEERGHRVPVDGEMKLILATQTRHISHKQKHFHL